MNKQNTEIFWTQDMNKVEKWFNPLDKNDKRYLFQRVSEKSKDKIDIRLDYFFLPLMKDNETEFYRYYVDYRPDRLHTARWFLKNVSMKWLVDNYKMLAKEHNAMEFPALNPRWRIEPNLQTFQALSTFAKAIVSRFQKLPLNEALAHLQTLHETQDKRTLYHLAMFLISKDTADLRQYAKKRYGEDFDLESFYCFYELKRHNSVMLSVEENHEGLANMINRLITDRQFAIELGRDMDISLVDIFVQTQTYLDKKQSQDFFYSMLYQRMLKNDKGVIDIIAHTLKKREDDTFLIDINTLAFIFKRSAHVMKKNDKIILFDLLINHVVKTQEFYDFVDIIKQDEKQHPLVLNYITQKEYELLSTKLDGKKEQRRYKI